MKTIEYSLSFWESLTEEIDLREEEEEEDILRGRDTHEQKEPATAAVEAAKHYDSEFVLFGRIISQEVDLVAQLLPKLC